MSIRSPGAGAGAPRRPGAPIARLETPSEGSVFRVTIRSLVLVAVVVLLVVVLLPALVGAASQGTLAAT